MCTGTHKYSNSRKYVVKYCCIQSKIQIYATETLCVFLFSFLFCFLCKTVEYHMYKKYVIHELTI